jgi:retinol-binding protein 3
MSDSPMIRPLCFATDKQSRREHSLLPTLVTLVVYFVESEVQKEILAEVRMFSRSCLAFVLGLAAALALQAIPQAPPQAQPAIPDTPAGHTFKAWFEAFNSGDRALLDAYLHKYDPGKPVDHEMHFRGMTGGFDLLQIVKSEPLSLEFLVKGRSDGITAFGKLEVKDSDPAQVAGFALRAIPPGTKLSDLNFKIDAATRTRVIDGAIAQLNESYVFPETAKKMGDVVKAKQKKGDYDSITDGDAFAKMLTDNFQEVSHDKHLRVDFSPAPMPDRPPGPPDAEARARYRKDMERMNCGFDKVEILSGNVGYLKFNFFADAEVCGPTAIAAMNFLANVDAIIFDLRENGGGDPKMVAFLSTYLFSESTHLNDLWERKGDATHQYWTLPYVPGKRLDGKPAYVLTSQQTFSGAEEFSYNLKNLKRATIIGETTGGGAHPVSGHRIDDHFMIGVPFARAINPISKTNWEGTGVEPDVKVPTADALATAQKLAAEKPVSK